MKWIKTALFAITGTGIALAAPVVPQNMQWYASYETMAFDTQDGDLDVGQFARDFEEDGVYWIRTVPKNEGQFTSTTSLSALEGKTEVAIRAIGGEHNPTCEGCKYYSEFINKDGKKVRVPFEGQYKELSTKKGARQPQKSELRSVLDFEVADAAGAYESGSEVANQNGVTSFSWSHTVTGDNRLLHVNVSSNDNEVVSSVTFNSDAMTAGESALLVGEIATFYMVAPDAGGSYTIAVTTSSGNYAGQGMSFTGIDQADPIDNVATTTNSVGTSLSTTISVEDGSIVADGAVVKDSTTLTESGDGTLRQSGLINFSTSISRASSYGPKTPAGNVTMTYTKVNGFSSAHVVVAYNDNIGELEQEGFAFGDDDGNESSHTLEAQDTNLAAALGTHTLRTLISASSTATTTAAFKLKFQKNGSGGYEDVKVGATSDVTPAPTTDLGTESGSNTASTTWPVAYPNAAAGDLIIFGISWDDSTTVSDVTEPAGPNSEVLSEINATPTVSSNTAVRAKVWYTIATGTWTASTLAFIPSASEQWTAAVVVIPAGQFDATTPIGATTTAFSSLATETNVLSGPLTAGASDGSGRLFAWTAVDDDPQTVAAGWTQVAHEDRGAVSGGMYTRDTVVTDSESISTSTVSTIAADDWVSVSFIVRPGALSNEVYVSTSGNVTAGGEVTTARLTAPTGRTTADFDPGRRWDDENGSDSIDIGPNRYTELEWVLTTQSPATTNDYFDFRVYKTDSNITTYTITPRWTIGASVISTSTDSGVFFFD